MALKLTTFQLKYNFPFKSIFSMTAVNLSETNGCNGKTKAGTLFIKSHEPVTDMKLSGNCNY